MRHMTIVLQYEHVGTLVGCSVLCCVNSVLPFWLHTIAVFAVFEIVHWSDQLMPGKDQQRERRKSSCRL